jgi:hypothetical protein
MNRYPSIINRTVEGCLSALDWIGRERLSDINDRQNLPNLFIGGRKVQKVPTSSADISSPTSVAGDFNVTKDFAFFCVNDAGTIKWVRVAVGAF